MEENNTESKEEVVEQKKCKKGLPKPLYWLIVICGCIFIFLGSYKIGYILGNYFGDKEESTTTTKKDTSNSNSNVTSNSNTASNSNSNCGSNQDECAQIDDDSNNKTNNETKTYTINALAGKFVSKEAQRSITFSTQYTFETELYGVPGCGGGTKGYLALNGNVAHAYPLIGTACDTDWTVLEDKGYDIQIASENELIIGGKKFVRENNTSLNESESGLRYGLKVLKEFSPEK